MATTRESNIFAIEAVALAWEEIPGQVLCVGESFSLDLTAYIPETVRTTLFLRELTSDLLPAGLSLTLAGMLSGTPTRVEVVNPVFIAIFKTLGVLSNEVNMAVLDINNDWSPSVSGLPQSVTATTSGIKIDFGELVLCVLKIDISNALINRDYTLYVNESGVSRTDTRLYTLVETGDITFPAIAVDSSTDGRFVVGIYDTTATSGSMELVFLYVK